MECFIYSFIYILQADLLALAPHLQTTSTGVPLHVVAVNDVSSSKAHNLTYIYVGSAFSISQTTAVYSTLSRAIWKSRYITFTNTSVLPNAVNEILSRLVE